MGEIVKWLFGFLAGALTKAKLQEIASDGAKLEGSVAVQMELGTFGESVAEEEERKRAAIIAFAYRQLGEPYAFGAEGPADADLDRWDCSELVEHSYRAGAEMHIPDGAKYQFEFCQLVKEPIKADLAYFGPNANGVPHIVMYAGDGVCIEARGRKVGGVQKGVVQLTPRHEIESHPRFLGWLRHPDFARPKEDRMA